MAAEAASRRPRFVADVGLSRALVARYEALGITELFDWQQHALGEPGVLDGRSNLLYTASTSGGKTLVAELLMLRRLEGAGQRAKALVVLPLKALVVQKSAELSKLLHQTGLKVAPYMSGCGEL